MKIRIRDNSLRLRLTQSEVEKFKTTGRVSASISFSYNQTLEYVLSRWESREFNASYHENSIEVHVPKDEANRWTDTDIDGISSTLPLPNNDSLTLLIEKDFQCLKVRENEDETDNYPNPLAQS